MPGLEVYVVLLGLVAPPDALIRSASPPRAILRAHIPQMVSLRPSRTPQLIERVPRCAHTAPGVPRPMEKILQHIAGARYTKSHSGAERAWAWSSARWTAQFHSTESIWLSSLWTMRDSEVLRGILQPILLTTFTATAIAICNACLAAAPGRSASRSLVQMHSLLGGALSLLLVFRTNSAYNRFWEARRIWENLLNRSRELARYAYCFRGTLHEARVTRIAQLLVAFPAMLRTHLCGESRANIDQHLSSLPPLPHQVRQAMERSSSPPLYLCKRLTSEIASVPDMPNGSFSSRERLMGLSLVNSLGSYVGACERLLQTPVPLNYARHTSRFLTLWCLSLPISLVGSIGLFVVPVTAFVTWSLFGIQEIGLFIEHCALDNGDIFMDQLSDQVMHDVIEAISDDDVPLDHHEDEPVRLDTSNDKHHCCMVHQLSHGRSSNSKLAA